MLLTTFDWIFIISFVIARPLLHHMEAYATVVRVSTTLIAVIGITAHGLVTFLTCRRGKQDHSAYVLLMQIYSCCVAVRIFTGWWVIYR